MSEDRILPQDLIQLVDGYVDSELASAVKFDNREPLDESGIYSLHCLAARIYAVGYREGGSAEAQRQRAVRSREFDRRSAAASLGGIDV